MALLTCLHGFLQQSLDGEEARSKRTRRQTEFDTAHIVVFRNAAYAISPIGTCSLLFNGFPCTKCEKPAIKGAFAHLPAETVVSKNSLSQNNVRASTHAPSIRHHQEPSTAALREMLIILLLIQGFPRSASDVRSSTSFCDASFPSSTPSFTISVYIL